MTTASNRSATIRRETGRSKRFIELHKSHDASECACGKPDSYVDLAAQVIDRRGLAGARSTPTDPSLPRSNTDQASVTIPSDASAARPAGANIQPAERVSFDPAPTGRL